MMGRSRRVGIIGRHELAAVEREIRKLKAYGRPVICTEWMARTTGSLVKTNLPVFARENVGCFNWGLVTGKTNTIYQWKELKPVQETLDLQIGPEVWFHDLLCADGTPYDQTEIEMFQKLTGVRRSFASGLTFAQPTLS